MLNLPQNYIIDMHVCGVLDHIRINFISKLFLQLCQLEHPRLVTEWCWFLTHHHVNVVMISGFAWHSSPLYRSLFCVPVHLSAFLLVKLFSFYLSVSSFVYPTLSRHLFSSLLVSLLGSQFLYPFSPVCQSVSPHSTCPPVF